MRDGINPPLRWCRPMTARQDIAYLRQRAADARSLAFSAVEQHVAEVHECFARLYLARALQLEAMDGALVAGEADPVDRLPFHPDWNSTGRSFGDDRADR
jgi:hypothetical protein